MRMTVQRGSLLQLLRQCCHLHAVQGHSPAASSNTSHLLASALVWLRQDGSNSSGSRWLPFGGASKGEKIPKPERKDVQPTPSVCRVDAAGTPPSGAASPSSSFWWLQGGSSQGQQPSNLVPAWTWRHQHSSMSPLLPPHCVGHPMLSSAHAQLQQGFQFHLLQQHRGYKSNKKSMKPVYARASKLAVRPLLPPIPPEERKSRDRYRHAPIIDTALPPIPTPPKPDAIKRVGFITRAYQLDMQPKFAVVELSGTQFKVTVDDVIFINSLSGQARINEVLSLGRVLLLGSTDTTLIGRPYVPGAYVEAAVEEHFLDGKVHVFKFKKRNRYRKYAAPRPQLTTLRILRIHGLPEPSESLSNQSGAQLLPQPKHQQGGQTIEISQLPSSRVRLPIKYYSESATL